ncbi:MAG: GNAT family N-acetyltransferase, partial [Clostridia bacterium]|nr:GNAT family N-acetyltransferase [Clostridia bacterium]
DGKLCGYFGICPEGEKLFLSKFYLKENFRGKGIGRAMMDEVCRLGEGLQAVYLTVNKQNHGPIAVYQKLGFQIVDSVETDIGNGYIMDDYIMEKSLELL